MMGQMRGQLIDFVFHPIFLFVHVWECCCCCLSNIRRWVKEESERWEREEEKKLMRMG
jgi:hypothetical protein